jgi:hypothetical protein
MMLIVASMPVVGVRHWMILFLKEVHAAHAIAAYGSAQIKKTVYAQMKTPPHKMFVVDVKVLLKTSPH